MKLLRWLRSDKPSPVDAFSQGVFGMVVTLFSGSETMVRRRAGHEVSAWRYGLVGFFAVMTVLWFWRWFLTEKRVRSERRAG